jgi:outer membrane protein TolC
MMKKSKTPLLIYFFLLLTTVCKSQKSMDSVYMLPDSVVAFSLDEFYGIVLKYHPLAKQAGLLNEMALQEIRMARGAFDPKVNLGVDRKDFEDKTYYDKLEGNLSIPTWLPINPKIGFENNSGQFLNNSEVIPGERQMYAGIHVPIGKGLLTDERRTALQQARLAQTMAEADQVKLINKLLLDAVKDYWTWYHAYYNFRLMNRATTIAADIFRRVKIDYSFGEAAVIDTVQANITLQTRMVEMQEALLLFQNSGITLSNYLWSENDEPLQISLNVAPVLNRTETSLLDEQTVQSLTEMARENHPELVKIRTKISQLELDNRLAREFLKPQLDLSYAVLSRTDPASVNFSDDYKFGLDFSIPIFLRKERSKFALTKLKIQETKFTQTQTEREIINRVNSTFNQITNTTTIISQLSTTVDLYDRILTAELLNLENGESDLFKINIQQEKLVQSQSKLLKATAEYQKMKASLYWAAGIRNLNLEH